MQHYQQQQQQITIMYTQRMFDMWSSVTCKLEAHANNLGQSNVQSPGHNNSSGSIKGKNKQTTISHIKPNMMHIKTRSTKILHTSMYNIHTYICTSAKRSKRKGYGEN